MNKRILLVSFAALALALVAALVWFVQRPTPPVSAATLAGPARPTSDVPARAKEIDAVAAPDVRRTESLVETEASAPSKATAATIDGPTLEIQVVRKSNGSPVAGAEISF